MSGVKGWLAAVQSITLPNVFNPYNSLCSRYDKAGAADVRLQLLSSVLYRAAENGVDSIWIGRDLGYRGGRRTGLALTDDVHLHAHLNRWGVCLPKQFLKGNAVAERTASVIWNELARIEEAVFLWNVFPFHPHEDTNPMSNRTHSSKERVVGEELLAWLIELLEPKRLVAIGQNAHKAAIRCATRAEVFGVRHPSYGGQTEFIRGIKALYTSEPV